MNTATNTTPETPEKVFEAFVGAAENWNCTPYLLLAKNGAIVEVWNSEERNLKILVGRVEEGYAPVGIVGIDIPHPQRERQQGFHYLPEETVQHLMEGWATGYRFRFNEAAIQERASDIGDDRFGVCPTCHKTDGFVNIGSGHWFYCVEHKVMWFFGSNIFSSWTSQTTAQQEAIYDSLNFDTFADVTKQMGKEAK